MATAADNELSTSAIIALGNAEIYLEGSRSVVAQMLLPTSSGGLGFDKIPDELLNEYNTVARTVRDGWTDVLTQLRAKFPAMQGLLPTQCDWVPLYVDNLGTLAGLRSDGLGAAFKIPVRTSTRPLINRKGAVQLGKYGALAVTAIAAAVVFTPVAAGLFRDSELRAPIQEQAFQVFLSTYKDCIKGGADSVTCTNNALQAFAQFHKSSPQPPESFGFLKTIGWVVAIGVVGWIGVKVYREARLIQAERRLT